MNDHEQVYLFPASGPHIWTVGDFHDAVQRLVEYASRHWLPMDDSSDPRIEGK